MIRSRKWVYEKKVKLLVKQFDLLDARWPVRFTHRFIGIIVRFIGIFIVIIGIRTVIHTIRIMTGADNKQNSIKQPHHSMCQGSTYSKCYCSTWKIIRTGNIKPFRLEILISINIDFIIFRVLITITFLQNSHSFVRLTKRPKHCASISVRDSINNQTYDRHRTHEYSVNICFTSVEKGRN